MTPATIALAALVLAGLASPALADAPTTNGAPVTASAASPGRAQPAESGARDTAATIGSLAIGATVRDANGALIGHIVLLTTDKQGHSVAKVREDEDVYAIPIEDLFERRGAAFSTLTLDQLKRGGGAIAAGPER